MDASQSGISPFVDQGIKIGIGAAIIGVIGRTCTNIFNRNHYTIVKAGIPYAKIGNPTHAGLACAAFIVVDACMKKAFNCLSKDHTSYPLAVAGRMAISIALTGAGSAALGLTPTMAGAAIIISTSAAINIIGVLILSKLL